MSGNVKYAGLCSTCKNASSCTFPRDPNKPVVHCEEFDSGEAPPLKTTSKERPAPTQLHAAKGKDATKFMGL